MTQRCQVLIAPLQGRDTGSPTLVDAQFFGVNGINLHMSLSYGVAQIRRQLFFGQRVAFGAVGHGFGYFDVAQQLADDDILYARELTSVK